MKRSREPEDPPTPSTLGAHDSDSEDFEETLLPTAKVIEIEALAEDEKGVAMKCFLPPHKEPQSFRTYAEYETHYRSTHTNRCVECGKNFPSAHLLDVHIEECHDSFAAVKRERGEQTVSVYIDILIAPCSWSTNAGLMLLLSSSSPASWKGASESAPRLKNGACISLINISIPETSSLQ